MNPLRLNWVIIFFCSVIDLREMAKVEEDTVIGILNLLSEGGAGKLPVRKIVIGTIWV